MAGLLGLSTSWVGAGVVFQENFDGELDGAVPPEWSELVGV